MTAVGCDAQEEVGGYGSDGDHKTHKGDEKVIVKGQGQMTGLETLLSEREKGGSLDFRGAPALSQLRICNTESRQGEREWNGGFLPIFLGSGVYQVPHMFYFPCSCPQYPIFLIFLSFSFGVFVDK